MIYGWRCGSVPRRGASAATCVFLLLTCGTLIGMLLLLLNTPTFPLPPPSPAACPSFGSPWLVPNRHLRSFPMRVSARRYTHSSPPSVYNHMLIPINLLLVGPGVKGGVGE